jgi:hypothetical protein
MALTKLDLEEARAEGKRRAKRTMIQARGEWEAPDTRMQIVKMWKQIKSNPSMETFYRENFPEDYKAMEKRYGQSTVRK